MLLFSRCIFQMVHWAARKGLRGVFALLEGVVVIVAQAFACGPVDHLEDGAGEEEHLSIPRDRIRREYSEKSVDAVTVLASTDFHCCGKRVRNRVLLSAHSQKWLCHC